ncbi:hypothetical protein [Bartonella harrusi]|uniref:Uncharacterized protein n=1 Tax=Bartonella harrusi TaxID=2961895 RepID=A0ABY5EXM4_9HYPH|nr:hypothetical protein [Bartonella harrusi]UTO29096.1 hypothetical protein NMK50_03820 [Bartonella harrusi]
MQEWIKIFLTGCVSFAGSLLVALILRNKDRKEAAKIRKDDLETTAKKREEDREWIGKQFAESQKQTIALKEQAMSTKDLAKWSEEHIKILLDNKRVEDLGTPPSIYITGPHLPTMGKWTLLCLKIKNNAQTVIHVLNIKLKDGSRFILGYGIRYKRGEKWRQMQSPYVNSNAKPKSHTISSGYCDKAKNFRTGQEVDVNIPIDPSEDKYTTIGIVVAAREENIKDQVTLIITHTSPLQPETTMTVTTQTNLIDFKKLD